ncbi:Patatin-like phospholipase family protein [Sulfidibacter corallicola]|uniref:Patatin-like phospholipase family protein n=1 Tax=Sulfidibacter corallicola TaxID=2818388 RepID=A0A8A4TM67_SULCO|nr:patatin-like phospholipase family protein [Sulfidibacter corallicola]QTD49961.1 patatin-like phospholipase family protein [Sulfidibacter corallicola]
MGGIQEKRPKIGLAMAGGGPEGAVYEIGAIRALDDAIEGLDVNDLHVYVGVSAGAFVTSCLANNVTSAQLARAVVNIDPHDHLFDPSMFLTPALGLFVKSGMMLPRLMMESIRDYMLNKHEQGLVNSFTRLGRAIPVGLFDNEPLREYLERVFNKPGRTDDFRQLGKKLFVIATDLDTSHAVVFGRGEYAHIPISLAVQASTALPGLYPPVVIEDRSYVDGVLRRTLHASTILDENLDLALCVNPIVPVDTSRSVEEGYMRRGKLTDRGMPTVLSQTFRTLIHSRMRVGFRRYDNQYKGTDLVLIEPEPHDYRMFFTNIFSFSKRKAVAEHAYRSIMRHLASRLEELDPVFEKHGMRLRHDVIFREDPDIWKSVDATPYRKKGPVTSNLSDALERLEAVLEKRKEKGNDHEPEPEPQEVG